MANFSTIISVATDVYATNPDVVIPFVPKRIRVINWNGAAVATVSLDGKTPAVTLYPNPLSPNSTHEWMWQISQKVWLISEGAVPVLVQIIAEA